MAKAAKLTEPRHASADGTPLRQVAALPYRKNAAGQMEVLLVTSRAQRRVIIPKGWREEKKAWRAAEKEAREEGGVVGKIRHRPLGHFNYWKRLKDHFAPVKVDVYPLKVEKSLKHWPEKRHRATKWLLAEDAALLVDEPRLVSILRDFARRGRKAAKAQTGLSDPDGRRISGRGALFVLANAEGVAG